MDDAAALPDWLALVRTPGFGPAGFRKLATAIGSQHPARMLACSRHQLLEAGLSLRVADAFINRDPGASEQDLSWLEGSPDRHLIPITDSRYPDLLRAIPDPPIALFARGDLDMLGVPQLAVVGSRNPTHAGRRTAREFARFLAHSGLAITSGLADGIDAAAHEGALQAEGMTIAVMGTGPDRIYPAGNRELATRIARSGLLLSELPPGTGPAAGHFPRRNRIIAGLALGVLVVEAAEKSGSLITARLAGENGREVLAIPGSIHNPLARGCHRLIRQGAKLVETAADILEEVAPQFPAPAAPEETPAGNAPAPDPEYQRLLEALGFDPENIDTLAERTGLTAEALSSMLLILELQGRVSTFPGGRYGRTNPDTPA
jgi:DNA processing protein